LPKVLNMKQVVYFVVFCPIFILAQFGNKNLPPESWMRDGKWSAIVTKEIKADAIEIERLKEVKHASYICATAIPTQINFSEFTLAEILPNSDKVYRLIIKSPNALGLMVMFENFKLEGKAKLWLYNKERTYFAGLYTEKDNYQLNGGFLTSHVLGNEIIVEYIEPKNVKTNDFVISRVYHYFRGLKSGNGNGFGQAGSCMINAICSEGNAKPAARDAACRIRVTGTKFSGFCSGTLVNNTSEDKTPYVLTANHCSAKSTITDLVNWEFDFLYQSLSCSNPSSEPAALTYKGCTAPAYSGTDNGENSSDFLLLKMNSALSTATYDFTFLGWDRADGNYFGNFCYHHPKGDIKKISTSNDWATLSSYGGNVMNTHFSMKWTSTSGGRSVTDEGSSGSALVNSNGLLIGTLTGGSALCTNLDGTDFYGRFFMHWDKYGSSSDRRLKPWLDPGNTGAMTVRSVKLSGAPASISENREAEKFNFTFNANQLEVSWLESGYELSVYNSLGQQVANKMTRNRDLMIDFSSLVNGIYIVEAKSDQGRKVVKISW
jgi:hypothetical protein